MPPSIEKRLSDLERSSKHGGMLVWRPGDPEPPPKLRRGQMCVRVYHTHMNGDGKLMTPAEIAAVELRIVQIAQEAEERAEAAAKEAEQRRAEALRVATQRAQGAEAAPAVPARHTVDSGLPANPVVYTVAELAERGWILTPQGLQVDLRRLGR